MSSKVKDIKSNRPFIISGPCSAESREQTLATCRALADTGRVNMLRAGAWKPRTMPDTFEGAGRIALEWLREARLETGLDYGVEVANGRHVELALQYGARMVWIGARTTISPFAVQEVADALKGIDGVSLLIKNPLVPDISLWEGALQRFISAGIPARNIALVHRGFALFNHGRYRNSPMWHIVLEMRRRNPHFALLCDPSHIAGRRELLGEVSQRAADLLFDGLMIESHICPDEALSDSMQQITPSDLPQLLDSVHWRSPTGNDAGFGDRMDKLRSEIDAIDENVFSLLSRRMGIADEIGGMKREVGITILQQERWSAIVERFRRLSPSLGLSEEFVMRILDAIHEESIEHQNSVMNDNR